MISSMVRPLATFRRALLVSALLGSGAMAAPAFAEPVHAVISVPSTETVPGDLSGILASWRQSGLVTDVTRLDYGDAEGPELRTLVVLTFESEAAYQAWNSRAAKELPRGITIRQADLPVSAGTHSNSRESSHYMVHIHGIPRTPNGLEEYEGFLNGYMKPLLDGQRNAGILLSYRMYIEREPNGGVGRSIWVAQYRDEAAYKQTSSVKPKIREDLVANDPTFRKYRQKHDGVSFYKGLREALAFYPADYVDATAGTR